MKKLLCLLLAFCFLFAGTVLAESPAVDVHLPLVEQDLRSPSGQKTTWSCVYFGSYPSAEGKLIQEAGCLIFNGLPGFHFSS